MLDIIIAFKPIVMRFLDVILLLFGSAFVTLGIIYIFGRMLEILKTDRPRNILAILIIYGIHYAYTYLPFITRIYTTQLERGWDVFIRGSISIVIYVVLCWRLYSRIGSFLDKKVGHDEFKPSTSKKKKRRDK